MTGGPGDDRAGPPPPGSVAALLAGPIRPGSVAWLGLRPARRAPMLPVAAAEAIAGRGLDGDRIASRLNPDGSRQVTLIAAEHLVAIAAWLGHAEIPPERLRRNVVTRSINLLALKGRRFRFGSALLEATGACHPCSRMEEELGPGGYNAVRGHGGITARVLAGGMVELGAPLTPA